MPLYKADRAIVNLPNEMHAKDFNWRQLDWFDYAFSSPQYDASAEADAEKEALAKFLNEKMAGPFYVMEGFANTRVLHLILLHPEDFVTCRMELAPKDWREEPDPTANNAEVILRMAGGDYKARNPAMAMLLKATREEMTQNGGKPDRMLVENVMRKVWNPMATV